MAEREREVGLTPLHRYENCEEALGQLGCTPQVPLCFDLDGGCREPLGRDNLLDWPTKLGIIVQKTDSTTLGYVVESLYTRMWRMKQKDPYACSALADAISEVLWTKHYVAAFMRIYPAVFNTGCNSSPQQSPLDVESIQRAKSYMHSP